MGRSVVARLTAVVVCSATMALGVVVPANAAVVCPGVAPDGTVSPAPSAGVDWSGCDLSHANLSGASLVSARLNGTTLAQADLTGADLSLASGWATDFTGASLVGANLGTSWWTAADLDGARLVGAALTGAWLSKASLDGAVLSETVAGVTTSAVLGGARGTGLTGTPALPAGWSATNGYLVGPGADLFGARLQDADLSGRDLTAADLTGATLTRVNLSGATFASASLLSTRITDSTLTGAAFTAADLGRLSSAGLIGQPAALPAGWQVAGGYLVGPGADLDGTHLDGLALDGAVLDGASLVRASLVGTHLEGASLVGVFVDSARMAGVHLASADLTGAELRSTDLTRADLHGATLTDAVLYYPVLDGADLRGAALGGGSLEGPSWWGANLTGATAIPTRSLSAVSWQGVVCPDGHLGEKHVGTDCFGVLDLAAPKLTMTAAPAVFVPSDYVWTPTIHVTAVDENGSAVVRYRYRSAHVGTTTFTSWRTSDWWGADAAFPLYWDMNDERRFCYQAQAKDDAGNLTAWTAEHCTDIVVDETFFLRKGTWKDGTGRAFTGNNFVYTTSSGATLTYERTTSTVKRVGISATTCATCGKVTVYVGATRIGTISLYSAVTSTRALRVLPVLSTRLTGRVRLVVTSPSGKLVRVNGVYLSAY